MTQSRPLGRAGPPIIQYWHAEKVPEHIAQLLQTFDDFNPDLRHLVFSEAQAKKFIAERFTAREEAAFCACAVPAMQADYFRYCAVLALGGIYSDVGFRCGADLAPLQPALGRGRLFRGPRGNVINGIFAFGAPGHSFLSLALEIATTNIERRLWNSVYFTSGPPIFMALVALHRHGSFDRLITHVAGSQFEEFAPVYCETIGDYERVRHALEGVEVSAVEEHHDFICPAGIDLPHRSPDSHWSKVPGRIFR